MRRKYKVLLAIPIVVVLILVGFVIWAETPPLPMHEAFDALQYDSLVTVSVDGWLIFTPASSDTNVGFIFYPGGRVDFRSYSPLAHDVAAMGYLVIIPKMPLNLAVFGVNVADDVIGSFPGIGSWAIGGHSLGGTMAAQFAYENPSKVSGLALLAAYPASGVDLSKSDLSVVTIHGTNDGLVISSQIDDSMKLLPPSTVRFDIVGGNHAYFGWYGDQAGDNPATITRDIQQNQTVVALVNFLHKLAN